MNKGEPRVAQGTSNAKGSGVLWMGRLINFNTLALLAAGARSAHLTGHRSQRSILCEAKLGPRANINHRLLWMGLLNPRMEDLLVEARDGVRRACRREYKALASCVQERFFVSCSPQARSSTVLQTLALQRLVSHGLQLTNPERFSDFPHPPFADLSVRASLCISQSLFLIAAAHLGVQATAPRSCPCSLGSPRPSRSAAP